MMKLTPEQNQLVDEMALFGESLGLDPITHQNEIADRILHKWNDKGLDAIYWARRAAGRLARRYKKDNAFDPMTTRASGIRRIRVGPFNKNRGLVVSELRYHSQKKKWVWAKKYYPTHKRSWDSAFLELKDALRKGSSEFVIIIVIK